MQKRLQLKYYRDTWCTLRFLSKVRTGLRKVSMMDVGSAWPPFLLSVDWASRREIVSKYFPSSVRSRSDVYDSSGSIKVTVEDWMTYHGAKADVVLCSQVLEHVPNPRSFMQKLLRQGTWVVVSVPYRWKDYDAHYHLWHDVTLAQTEGWAGKHAKSYSIVRESDGGKRLIAVFRGSR